MENMTAANDRLNDILASIIQETLWEGDILEHKTVDAPAVMELCKKITERVPEVEADLKSRFPKEGADNPDHFLPEVVMSLVHLAWDYGFRAGRTFEARDYGLSEEEKNL